MRTYLDCTACFVRQALESARFVTDDPAVQERVLREVLSKAAEMDFRQTPPAMGRTIHRIIRRITENHDPYLQVKQRSNEEALRLYPDLERRISGSDDPVAEAIRLAIAGNIIDFGVPDSAGRSDLVGAVRGAEQIPLDSATLQQFKDSVEQARSIMYIGDNAGEIVFDRMLVEQLPRDKVTFVVRGAPAINDATMADARDIGLTEIVEVIDTGSDAPGVILEACSEEFLRRFKLADLVIAKGQGNYETLNEVGKDIFFILRTKCPVIARHLACPVGTSVFAHSPASENSDKENRGLASEAQRH